MMAPSHDPHDFVSVPVYFWPNPETPDGLPWVRRDGRVNPAAVDSDVGRFFGLVDDAEILALRRWYCGDEGAGTRVLDLVAHVVPRSVDPDEPLPRIRPPRARGPPTARASE